MYFTIQKDTDGIRARLWSENGNLIWWTEGYTSEANALNAIKIAVATNSATLVYRR